MLGEQVPGQRPEVLAELREAAEQRGFGMSSDEDTGCLLATLAAARPGGRLLELGTGVGQGTAWLLSGMTADATLVTVERDAGLQEVGRKHLGGDPRVDFVTGDAGAWLEDYTGEGFDLVFADTWPGKFTHLDTALGLVRPGGMYVIDDLLPHPGWPEGHTAAVDRLLEQLAARPDFRSTRLTWSTGLLLAVRTTR